MSKVLIVYCSMSGNTKAAAEAIAAGAKKAGAQVTIKTGAEAQAKDLLDCDAVALGSHDAFSYMGGGLKDFLIRPTTQPKARLQTSHMPLLCLLILMLLVKRLVI